MPTKITNKIKAIANKKGKKFANAFSAAGSARKILNKIINQLDFEWSIQNGTMKILELEDVDDSPIIELASQTGLIDLPIRIHDLKNRKETKKKVKKGSTEKNIQRKGWSIKSLLMADIEPGGRIKIVSSEAEIDDVFRTESVEHKGDNYGTEWNTFAKVSDIT